MITLVKLNIKLDKNLQKLIYGEMAEWFKAHAWKACKGLPFMGSNPILSAIK